MTALPPSGTFMMVDPAHVAEVGPAAALLYARIAWRSDQGPWRATRAELSEETGLSLSALRTAVSVLRDGGWVTSERTSPDDATLVWKACPTPLADFTPPPAESAPPPLRNSQDPPAESAISSLETVETTTRPTADAVQEPEVYVPEPLDTPALFAVPDPEPDQEADAPAGPPKTAQTLVARWVDGYRSANGGQDPPGPLMGRVAGQCRNVAKGCKSHDDWVASYAASYTAGQECRADITGLMGARRRYGKVNHDLENLQRRLSGAPMEVSAAGALPIAMLTAEPTRQLTTRQEP